MFWSSDTIIYCDLKKNIISVCYEHIVVWPLDTTISHFFVITYHALIWTRSSIVTLWELRSSSRKNMHAALIRPIHHEKSILIITSTNFFIYMSFLSRKSIRYIYMHLIIHIYHYNIIIAGMNKYFQKCLCTVEWEW